MNEITKNKKLELAQKFFEIIWKQIEEGDDYIYEELDEDGEYGEELCEMFNNDTILEVLRIGFREKFGQDLNCGKLSSEILSEQKSETPKADEVPEPLEPCPKCGEEVCYEHPTFDGGTYISCHNCHYSPQTETWAPTDAQAAKRWNNLCEKGKAK